MGNRLLQGGWERIILTVTPPPLFVQTTKHAISAAVQAPSMVSCIHSQRVLIMYQTIMSQSLASMRKLPLPRPAVWGEGGVQYANGEHSGLRTGADGAPGCLQAA